MATQTICDKCGKVLNTDALDMENHNDDVCERYFESRDTDGEMIGIKVFIKKKGCDDSKYRNLCMVCLLDIIITGASKNHLKELIQVMGGLKNIKGLS